MKYISLAYCRGIPYQDTIHNNINDMYNITNNPRYIEILKYDNKTNFKNDLIISSKLIKNSFKYLKEIREKTIELLANKYKYIYLYINLPNLYIKNNCNYNHNTILLNSFICNKCLNIYYTKYILLNYINKLIFNLPNDVMESIIFISLDNYIANMLLLYKKNNTDIKPLVTYIKSLKSPLYTFIDTYINNCL